MTKKKTTVKSPTKKSAPSNTKKSAEKKTSGPSNNQFTAFDDVGRHVHDISMNFVTESMKVTEEFMQCRTFDDFVKLQVRVMDNYHNFIFGEVSKLNDTLFNTTMCNMAPKKSKDFNVS